MFVHASVDSVNIYNPGPGPSNGAIMKTTAARFLFEAGRRGNVGGYIIGLGFRLGHRIFHIKVA